ncbi:MAG: hypothetical protein NTV86_04240 [Planctomycetota bacterium]|nr:hypothetical protein [Planctomycetota bacterium]
MEHPNNVRDDITTLLDGKKVLLVEDDAELAERIAEILNGCGVVVVSAHSVETAIRKYRTVEAEYSLLIIDCILPETETDLEAMRQLEAELHTELQVIRSLQHVMNPTLTDLNTLTHARNRRAAIRNRIAERVARDGGLLLARALKTAEAGPDAADCPPFLFFSALGSDDLRRNAEKEFPGCRWLVKTGLEDVLLGHIRELLMPKSHNACPNTPPSSVPPAGDEPPI